MRPRPLRRVLALLCLAVGAVTPAIPALAAEAPGDAPVRVEWEAEGITVGDLVPVTITVTTTATDDAAAPRFPTWGSTWGEAEIVEVGEPEAVPATPEADAGSRTWRQALTLAAFRTGSVALPPREILLPGEDGRSRRLTTPPGLSLQVASVLTQATGEGGADEGVAGDEADAGAAETPEPLAAKSMVALPVGAAFWWTAAVMSAALLALGWLIYRRHAAATAGAAPALSPADELSRALADARRAPSAAEGLVAVSWALRRYLARRLAFPALESTTTEIRRQLRRWRRGGQMALPGGFDSRCAEILSACDLVKFARRPATHADARQWADAADALAVELEAHLRPLEEAEAAAAAEAAEDGKSRREKAA